LQLREGHDAASGKLSSQGQKANLTSADSGEARSISGALGLTGLVEAAKRGHRVLLGYVESPLRRTGGGQLEMPLALAGHLKARELP
jgi:hypothetical protein